MEAPGGGKSCRTNSTIKMAKAVPRKHTAIKRRGEGRTSRGSKMKVGRMMLMQSFRLRKMQSSTQKLIKRGETHTEKGAKRNQRGGGESAS